MRRLLMVGLAGVAGVLLLSLTPARAQTAPTLITVAFGPQQVFPLPGSALLDLQQQCPPEGPQGATGNGSASCVAQAMQQQGASPDAVAFYLLTGHILVDYQPYGTVNAGTVTYNIWCCTADSTDTEPVLLGGTPAVIYPLEVGSSLPLSRYQGYAAAVEAFPRLENSGIDRITLEQVATSPEQGQRFIYDIALDSGCRACGTGYIARLAFDFDGDGSYIGAVPLEITCRETTSQMPTSSAACAAGAGN